MCVDYILPAFIFFAVFSGGTSKCTPTSVAARLEDELREEGQRGPQGKILLEHGNILTWNCTSTTTEATATDIDIEQELLSELSSGTTPSDLEEEPSINTYVLVYQNILQSQDLIDNITSSLAKAAQQEEEATRLALPEADVRNVSSSTRSPLMVGVVTDVQLPQLARSSGHTNIAQGPQPVLVLIGEDNGVVVLNVSHPDSSTFLDYTSLKAYSVDRHKSKDLTFLAGSGTILRSGSSLPVVTSGVDGPLSLAVDWQHDRLYWLSTRHRVLEAADLDGANRTLLVDNIQQAAFPNNIALDPSRRYIFFVANHTIYRSNLNGRELTQLRLTGNSGRSVKCLALDVQKQRIFFSGRVDNPETPYLASVNYEGENHKDHLLGGGWTDIYGLSVQDDILYFAHYSPGQNDSLWSLEVSDSGGRPPTKLYESSPLRGVREYDPSCVLCINR